MSILLKSSETTRFLGITIITSIPINTKIGNLLKQNAIPNTTLNKFISNYNSYTIYTDGSKIGGSNLVATACICQKLTRLKKKKHYKYFFRFHDRMYCNDALDNALLNPDDNFKILSDFLSVLFYLQNPKIDIKINCYIFEIKKKYNKFKQKSTNSNIELL